MCHGTFFFFATPLFTLWLTRIPFFSLEEDRDPTLISTSGLLYKHSPIHTAACPIEVDVLLVCKLVHCFQLHVSV